MAALESFRQTGVLRKMLIDLGRIRIPEAYHTNLSEQGHCLRLLGCLDESAQLYEQVLNWRREIHRNHKYIPNPLAGALTGLARTQQRQGRLMEALANIAEAVQIRRDLIDRGYTQREVDWASSRTLHAELLSLTGRKTEAYEAITEAMDMLKKYYSKGRYSLAKDFSTALILQSHLMTEQQSETALANLSKACDVLEERWKGGSYIIVPEYLDANRVFIRMLLHRHLWPEVSKAVCDHFACLAHIEANLPKNDPEPLTRCKPAAEAFLTDMRKLSFEQREHLLKEQSSDMETIAIRLGWL
jgi:tetratricopeptide (TPR) repeat protein